MSKIVKNTSIYTIGNILPQAIGFLLLPIFTRYLTPEDYGIVASMGVLSAILATLYTLCLQRSIPRLFFDYKDEQGQRDFLGTIFISSVSIAVVVLCLVFIFKGFIEKIYKTIDFYPFYVYAIFTCFFSIFSHIPRIYLQVKEKARDFVVLSLAPFILGTGLALWFVCILKQGAEGRLRASLIGASIFLPIYLVLNLRIINLRFNFGIFKESLSFSLPFIPTIVSAWILNLSDRIFIERYFDLHEVGIYSLGYGLAMISLIVAGGFQTAYSPVFYRLATWEEPEKAKSILKKWNNTYAVAFLLLTFFIALFSKEVVFFLMDERYVRAYEIVRIIAFSNFFVGISGIASFSIMQLKRSKQNMYIALGMALLNICLNFVLIPPFALYGAAVATLLSFITGYVVLYWYSKRCYFIPLNWGKLSFYISFVTLVILTYHFWIEKNMYVSLISKVILLCIGAVLFLVNFKKIKKAFSVAAA